MTLRDQLGEDVDHVVERVNDLLDSEDALLVCFDGRRTVSYVHGFSASPCQLEFLSAEIERLVRSVVGRQSPAARRVIGNRGTGASGDRRVRSDTDQPPRRGDGASHSRAPHIGDQRLGSGRAAGHRLQAAGRVLRLAGGTP
jgi:hypothetical protein